MRAQNYATFYEREGKERMLQVNRKGKILLMLIATLLVAACACHLSVPAHEEFGKPPGQAPTQAVFQQEAPPALAQRADRLKDYVIGPEDVLQIQVWDHSDLERSVFVSREGFFSYPLIGQVQAGGLTVAQLEKEIAGRLGKGYLVSPQVTVTVKEYRSQKVFVLGEVVNPAKYALTGQTTLLDVLAQAGGPTPEAGAEVIVIRPVDGRRKNRPTSLQEAKAGETITVDLQRLMNGDIPQNMSLRDGDTVYVSKAQYFFVYGEVKKPGRYVLTQGTTVLKAITTAGGITDIAAVKRTKIVREKTGVRVKLKAKLSDWVFPEDIVMVPQSFF